LKLHCSEGLQISPKTEDIGFDLTCGILSKVLGIALILLIRFAYEAATFEVSAL
jgi:hypothetical protein